MGTSTNYAAPPQWSALKGDLTRNAGSSISPTQASQFLRDHIANDGGARNIAAGRGVLGSGRSARSVAKSFASFVSDVARLGLPEALRENGLQHLVGRPVNELLVGLIDHVGRANGSIDAADARSALSRLLSELFEGAQDPAEAETLLSSNADGRQFADLLMQYFACYLFEQFCRLFFEHLAKKHGEQRAEASLGEIRQFVEAALRDHTLGMDVSKVDWSGKEGDRIMASIMQTTLEVYEE